MSSRTATMRRDSKETQIALSVDLDMPSPVAIDTPLPFFTHMLDAFATHGRFGLDVHARGDIEVDPHHLMEDVGIVLGQALSGALGSFKGIERAGYFAFPMDRSLAIVAIDLCGRANLVWNVELKSQALGTLDPHLFLEFFKGLADGLRATIHVNVPYRDNDHHVIESIFKAFARALRSATRPLADGATLSTKGMFDGE